LETIGFECIQKSIDIVVFKLQLPFCTGEGPAMGAFGFEIPEASRLREVENPEGPHGKTFPYI
jgi:hypothetical protein